jgi:transcription initiation factor TFIIB
MSTTEANHEPRAVSTNQTPIQTTDPPEAAQEGEKQEATSCPECSGSLITDGCETVCSSCGLVVDEEQIDHGPEWGRYEDDRGGDPRRAATIDRTHHDNGMGSAGYEPADKGDLSAKRRAMLSSKSKSRKPRETGKAIGDIKRAGSALDLPQPTVDNACVLFKKFHKGTDHHGHNLDHMAAAALYGSVRCSEDGVTHTRIATQFDIEDSGDIFKEVRRLSEMLDVTLPISTPAMYVPRIVDGLDGATQTDTIARQLATRVEGTELTTSGNSPICVAAAVVYEAFTVSTVEDRPTQEEVGEVADVSAHALRKHWKTMRDEGFGGDPRTT